MATPKSLMYRIGIGKAIGFLIGIIGFICLPYFIVDASLMLRLAILFWYPTIGAVIGVFGVFTRHPMFNLPMPWWFRGALLGGWMNFVLTLFAYEQISVIVIAVMGEYSAYTSPFLMVIEGAIIGMLIDFIATRYFGEGWVGGKNSN